MYVVAGALVDERGRVLIAQRPEGKAFAGRWEFPGGKKLAHETPRDTLNRELLEELGVQVAKARPLITVSHRYSPDAEPVVIDCWVVEQWRGEISSLDGQQLRWCEREELPGADILEADRPIVTALRLPGTLVRVDDPESLAQRLPGPRGRERAAWIVPALPRDERIVERLLAHGDHVFLLETDVDVRTAVAVDAALRGRVVRSAADARDAVAAAADFLLVPDRALASEEFAGIAAVGLPFYVNVAMPAGPDEIPATGKLWWKTG